jgi:hypothetical protein
MLIFVNPSYWLYDRIAGEGEQRVKKNCFSFIKLPQGTLMKHWKGVVVVAAFSAI